ncbi:hypothetical protein HED51_21480 [Ochrobactrum grignonense]|nr:hypothetical protein [Brucella grignonensis]
MLVSASNAQEDQPFHTSYFADETTISLSVTVAATSLDPEYNFDVQVALTERGPEGQIRFIDHSAHLAKVRCAAPKAVMIGQSEFMLSDSPEPGIGSRISGAPSASCRSHEERGRAASSAALCFT